MLNSPITIYVSKEYRKIQIGAESYQLSEAEITLLTLLLEAKGQPLSKDVLLARGWDGRIVSPTSLPVSIKHIRDIFKRAGYTEVLCTVKNGGGYFIFDGVFSVQQLERAADNPFSSSVELINENQEEKTALEVETNCKANDNSKGDFVAVIIVLILSLVVLLFIYNAQFVYEKDNLISNAPISTTLDSELETLSITHQYDYLFTTNNGTYLACNTQSCGFIK